MCQGFFVFLGWELITTFSICEGVFQNGDPHGPFLFSLCYHVMSHYKHYYRTLFWVNHAAFQVVQWLTFGSENSFNSYVIDLFPFSSELLILRHKSFSVALICIFWCASVSSSAPHCCHIHESSRNLTLCLSCHLPTIIF